MDPNDHKATMIMTATPIMMLQRRMCGESWRCMLAMCYGMIIASMDMVETALPTVSVIGSRLMNLSECTLSPLAEAIEGWSRKRTRWRNMKNKVKGGRRRVHHAMTALVACPAGV